MRRNDVIVTKGTFEGPFVKPYIASLMFVAQYIPSDKSTTLFAFFLLRAVEHKNTEVAGNISPRLEPFFSRFFYKWHFTTAGSIQCIIVLRMTHCNRSGTTICWRNTIDCCLQNSTFSPTSDSCIFPLLCSKLWFLNLWKTMKLSGAPTQDCNALLNVISQWWHFPANIPKKKKKKVMADLSQIRTEVWEPRMNSKLWRKAPKRAKQVSKSSCHYLFLISHSGRK